MKHAGRRSQADQDRFQSEQAAGLQGVALERHGEAENEFRHQQPTRNERARHEQHQRIDQQKQQDATLVPTSGAAQKIVQHGA